GVFGGTGDWQEKVQPSVLVRANAGSVPFLIFMKERADLSGAAKLASKVERGYWVYEQLNRVADRSQRDVLAMLDAYGVAYQRFWAANMILSGGSIDLIKSLASREDVRGIYANPTVHFPEPMESGGSNNGPDSIEWNVIQIGAVDVWTQGFFGQGIVVGGEDTGYQWDHPALINHYRGWNGSAASHDYNWHDSIHSGGGVCGPNSPAPCDDNNHGTHTLGTAVGDDGGTNQIGVAPGAKFIACRNMNGGNGTPATYIECMEWFLAPYPVGGNTSQGDPAKAPDITTNSWTCPPSEGCSPGTLQSAVESQRTAGIMMVVAAGNSGSACSTVSDPPSFYDASYTAGAFDSSTGTIASFSSRGPVTIDGSNRRKPDITAPGVSVRSSVRGGGYSAFRGTSMAAPHTAGAVALLWSSHPELRHQISDTENILDDSAVDVATTSCGSSGVPNNVYGFGRLNIKAAVDLAAASISPTSTSFGGGGGTGTV